MAQVKQWSRFGWQGVLFGVPSGWELTRSLGNRKTGFARLSDPETARKEVRWETPRRGVPFRSVADRAIRQLAKGRGTEIERHTGMVELEAMDTETFHVQGVWCGRSFLVQPAFAVPWVRAACDGAVRVPARRKHQGRRPAGLWLDS